MQQRAAMMTREDLTSNPIQLAGNDITAEEAFELALTFASDMPAERILN